MKSNRLPYIPTDEQELLLKAALLTDSNAASCWREWRQRANLDHLDSGSFRLLPLAYVNLQGYELQDPFIGKMKGIYRRSWLTNRLIEKETREIVAALGVDTLVLKGLALTIQYYEDFGSRPMEDSDVLVRLPDLELVFARLAERGWIPIDPVSMKRVPYIHSVNYRHPDKEGFDLHWHVIEECCRPSDDALFWEDAVALELNGGIDAFALSSTDQLFHVLVHGARWNIVPPIRWVPDALMILRGAGESLQWDRLLGLSEQMRLSLPVFDTLRYLKDTFDAGIPDDVLIKLGQIPATSIERSEYSNKLAPLTPFRRMKFHWYNHLRQTYDRSTIWQLFHWPIYLRYRWGYGGASDLPAFAVSKMKHYKSLSSRAP